MEFVPQLPYLPDLKEIPRHTTPDWDALKSNPTNPITDYRLMRRMQYLTDGQLAKLRARASMQPLAVLIITGATTTDAQVETTRASLAYMGYERVYAQVVESSELAYAMCALEAPLALWVEAGDTLAPYTALLALDAADRGAEYRAFYMDEEAITRDGPTEPFFKPDLSVEWLRSGPYVGRGLLVRTEAFHELDLESFTVPALAAYETVLRLVECAGRYVVGHLREVLYISPQGFRSWVSQPSMLAGITKLVTNHLKRQNLNGQVVPGLVPGTVRVRYQHEMKPKVSLIVPAHDQLHGVRRLIESILTRTNYPNYEIIIVDSYSVQGAFIEYLKSLQTLYCGKIRAVHNHEPFNYPQLLKAGIMASEGAFFCVLTPDMVIQQNDWLSLLMEYGLCENVAQVGSLLTLPNGTIHHAGVILGLGNAAGHIHLHTPKEQPGYFGRLKTPQDLSAVTCAGTLVNRAMYDEVGGYDSDAYSMIFHDVDLSIRFTSAGYRTIWTPYVGIMTENNALEGMNTLHRSLQESRTKRSLIQLRDQHLEQLGDDPYFNPHLSLTDNHPSMAYRTSLGWSPNQHPLLPKVITYPSDKSGCGMYRVHGPFDAMKAQGVAEGFASEWMIPLAEMVRLRPDTLILQRKMSDGQLLHMDDYRRHLKNTFRIYEIDDLLHDIPPKSIHHGKFPKDTFARVVRAMQSCDRVVASTQPLADAFSDYHHDVVVRKNRLIPRAWKHIQAQRHTGPVPRVGWGGGSSHRGDLEMIAEVIKHFHGKVQWVFFGMLPDMLKPYVKEFHSAVGIGVYPQMLASLRLDLALAPVEDNRFNACKSNLRVLEYGACGYPVIASDVAAYNMDDLPVIRVSSNPDDWISAINEHLQDRDELYRRGVNLRNAIHQDWFLEGSHVTDWLQAWLP